MYVSVLQYKRFRKLKKIQKIKITKRPDEGVFYSKPNNCNGVIAKYVNYEINSLSSDSDRI